MRTAMAATCEEWEWSGKFDKIFNTDGSWERVRPKIDS
jgi:hypothetical protein